MMNTKSKRPPKFSDFCGLTKPQWELLCGIVDGTIKSSCETYKPRMTLEAIGMIRVYAPGWASRLIETTQGIELVKRVRKQLAESE